ncbi:hypothetical protein E2C01_004264 [Portunus trituberculatus]|uniref:Uncharacterized protein n=1 Tax=Portunus trituberculatus TaxID=210409 RepID=A0A5B7CSJ9_PORTR|nr:hypothetical protein [Portunus trituberculatus]
MSGFDEILGTKIEVRKRTLGTSLDKDLCDGALEQDLFPEFTKLLEDAVPGDDESEGCPLPGTPEDESLIDAKEFYSCDLKNVGHGSLLDVTAAGRMLYARMFLCGFLKVGMEGEPGWRPSTRVCTNMPPHPSAHPHLTFMMALAVLSLCILMTSFTKAASGRHGPHRANSDKE